MSDKLSEDLRSLKIDRQLRTGDGGRTKWLVIGIVLLILLLVAGAVALFPDRSGLSGLGAKAREVETTMVVRQSSSAENVVLTAGGYIIPRHRVEVSSKISGRVEQLLTDKGEFVRAGQVLARLDDREIRAQLEQARASVQAGKARLDEYVAGSRPQEIQRSQATLEQEEADLRTAQVNLDRSKELHSKNVLSKQLLDDAQNRSDMAVARVKVSRQNLDLARIGPRKEQIDLARAQLAESEATVRWWESQLENSVIRAPVDGTVLERLIEKGEMVTTGFTSARGAKSALVSIANLKVLEVELDINEADIPRVFVNQNCTVAPDSYPEHKYKAKVREIAPEANRQKATIQVKVSVFQPDQFLRPETNAKVNFLEEAPVQATESRILIPKSSVVGGQGEAAVFLVREGKAVRQKIKAGKELWGQIEVSSGLIGGERLIVKGLENLTDGERVTVK